MSVSGLWQAFCRTVEQAPAHAAFLCGDQHVRYADWHRRAADFATAYRDAGLKPHDRVLILIRNEPDIAAAIVGAWAAGAIPVFLDAAAPESHVRHALATAQPKFAVLPETGAALTIPGDLARAVASTLPSAGVSEHAPRVLPTDPASIVFTSGSTGKPKGVTQSHGNLQRGCQAVAGYLGLRADDRLLCPVPWSFDYGYGQLLTTALLGVTQVLPVAPNPFSTCEAISLHRPTVLAGLPSLYTYLMRGLSPIRKTDLSSLRLLTNTGGSIPGPVLRDLLELFTHCRVVLNYGLTETYRSCYLPPELVREKSDSIGFPIPGADIVIVGDDGRVCSPGEEGQIVHRGDYICLGYWNNPEATAATIRPDPLAPPDSPDPGRALYTGDYGCRDEAGFIYYRGRRDQQLKCMGVRVNPGEVEQLLHESGLVREVAVFGVPHDLLGHEIWAAVVPAAADQDAQGSLQRYAQQAMSQYMMPRRYLLRSELPKTPNGKTDYPALRAEATAAPSAALTA